MPDRRLIAERLRSVVQQAIEKERQKYGFPARVIRIVAPQMGLIHTFSTGYADLATKTPITGREVFRIASITKTFTAAAVLRQVETGRLALDDPIDGLLADEYLAPLRNADHDPTEITVRHLLLHTSGLRDPDDLEAAVLVEPSRRWTPLEQVRHATEGSGPVGTPGMAFHYCDVGYTLLARIVEGVTGLPQAEAYRHTLRFATLGLRHSWFESLEDAPAAAPPRAHQYWRDRDISHFDPSIDLYGGGGLLSTVRDLTEFFHALFAGRVFDRPSTLPSMLESPLLELPACYGMGIRHIVVDGVQLWGHSGYWGCSCFHVPELDLTFAATRNVVEVPQGYDRTHLIRLLLREL